MLIHKDKNDKLEKTQQLKYYFKRLYGQVFFDEKTGELCRPNIQDQQYIDFKPVNQGENYESFSKSTN